LEGNLTLSALKPGTKGKITRIAAQGGLKRRLLDMGLVPGAEIVVEGVAPLGDPLEVKVRGYHLSLRKSEAANVWIEIEE